jgi:DNA-binding Xre family transcriptional regulator
MLYFNFTRIIKARGIDKPFSFMVKQGFSDNFATKIINNRVERMNLKEVERLCNLFQCTPNDLLEWIPSRDESGNDKHPLAPLKRVDKVMDLTKLLYSVPMDKLSAIEEMIINETRKT